MHALELASESLIARIAPQGPSASEEALLQLQAFIASKGAPPASIRLR